jgi:L-iditol 2-dehydrogenase
MKAAVLHKARDLRLDEVPTPAYGPDDVLVEIKSVGICGSDVHYLRTGRIGDYVVKSPMILGHEVAGVVAEIGKNVTSLSVGDRVALEPGVPCRRCEACKTGRYNLCPEVRFFATPPFDGALSDYAVSPADFAYKIPDTLSLDAAALIEPLSVGLHACRRGGLSAGQSVFIAGAGPIGLTSLAAAKAFGATEIFISDVKPHRLEIAKKMGATHTFSAREDAEAIVREATGGRGVDLAIECAGAEAALVSCLKTAKSGGTIVVVGLGDNADYTLPIVELAVKELDIKGIFRYAYTYPAAIKLLASGTVNLEAMITHHFPLDDMLTAFEYAEKGTDGAVKVMIDV